MTNLFSADGIRLSPGDISLEFSERLGIALSFWLHSKKIGIKRVIVATDTRNSCTRLKAVLTNSLNQNGISVVDAGILPTAGLSYVLAHKHIYDAGIMITASHNPVEENGIKVFNQKGRKINIWEEQIIANWYFAKPEPVYKSEYHVFSNTVEHKLKEQYIESLTNSFTSLKDYYNDRPILIDCANGAASNVIDRILENLRIQHIPEYNQPTGVNINRYCGSEYHRIFPKKLQQSIINYNALFGVSFDGDADRVIFIDRFGRVYDGDDLLAIIAPYLKKHHKLPNDTIVITQMSNSALIEYFREQNILVEKVKNGDKYITEKLLSGGYSLGGEQIGHIIYHDDKTHLTGDGIRTMLLVLEILAESSLENLSELLIDFKKHPQINASVYLIERTDKTVDSLPNVKAAIIELKSSVPDLLSIECRPASTEPVYRIMLEAKSTPVEVLTEQSIKLAKIIHKDLNIKDCGISIRNCVNGGVTYLDHYIH